MKFIYFVLIKLIDFILNTFYTKDEIAEIEKRSPKRAV